MEFDGFFEKATGNLPFPYQRRLATDQPLPQMIDVPTGAGKTAAVILSWLWRRRFGDEARRRATPRRLVYCLPMRVLVEQTEAAARTWVQNLGCQDEVRVHVLMGGEDAEDWDVHPERDAILVGTQDMLLSRALNRGYGMSRYRWPMHFGLLNNDCLWVLDEVQLMGSGLATSTQLQAFREKLGTWGTVQTIWMSATLRPEWLETVDFKRAPPNLPLGLSDDDRRVEALKKRLEAKKPIEPAEISVGDKPEVVAKVAAIVKEKHRPGSLTLVVVNTVERARNLYNALFTPADQPLPRKGGRQRKAVPRSALSDTRPELLLIHSRFRPPDRQERNRRLTLADKVFRTEALPPLRDEEQRWIERIQKEGLIVVATQVIEAGVDISARTLITELAPWPSLVQRFGRCNRFGKYGGTHNEGHDNAQIFWIDVPKGSLAAPYEDVELDAAREMLNTLEPKDVGPAWLEKHLEKERLKKLLEDKKISAKMIANLFRNKPARTIRQHDLHGLFSTEPDLAGGFTDISAFVRDRERNADVYVLWRAFEGDKPEADQPAVHRDELCSIPIYDLAAFLRDKGYAWEWNGEIADWERRRAKEIRPGMTLMLHVTQGGYHSEHGWTGRSEDKPLPYEPGEKGQDDLQSEPGSQTDWLSLPDHLSDTEGEARRLVHNLGCDGSVSGKAVVIAAWWHDVGKCHAKWQEPLRAHAPEGICGPWAKFKDVKSFRPGLRHEAASALAAWQQWQSDADGWTALAVYLIATHHGKVRTVLRGTAGGDDVFGIRSEDGLPPLPGWLPSEMRLDLSPKAFGATGEWNEFQGTFTPTMPSWVGMVAELLGPELPDDPVPCDVIPQDEPRCLGPFLLAFFETLVRVADARASRSPGRGRGYGQGLEYNRL